MTNSIEFEFFCNKMNSINSLLIETFIFLNENSITNYIVQAKNMSELILVKILTKI